ncbi:MAG: type II 3-dehydroquinate dehydratase [Pseudomonadota bacterium]
MATSLLIINGPGLTYSESFGAESFDTIHNACTDLCASLNIDLDFRQSDDPQDVIQWIKRDAASHDALIINQMGCMDRTPIDYKHYAHGLRALQALQCRVIEVNLTNVFRDDPGVFTPVQGPSGRSALISGLGVNGYRLAIRAAHAEAQAARSS